MISRTHQPTEECTLYAIRPATPLPAAAAEPERLPLDETRLRAVFESMPDGIVLIDGRRRFAYANPAASALCGIPREEIVGRPLTDCMNPDFDLEAAWTEFLRTGRHECEYRMVRTDGESRYARVIATADVFSGYHFVVLHNITDRKLAERASRESGSEEEWRRANERNAILSETAGLLLKSDQPRKVIDALCQKLTAYIDAQVYIHYRADSSPGRLRLSHWGGLTREESDMLEHLDCGQAVCGQVARDHLRIVVEDIQRSHLDRDLLIRAAGLRAYACHPLIAHGELIGTLAFGTKTKPRFSEDELALMQSVCDFVAVALERFELLVDLREARAEAERRADEMDSIFAALSEAIFVYDERDRISRVNPAAREGLGFDPTGMSREAILEKLVVRNEEFSRVAKDELPSQQAREGEMVTGRRLIVRTEDGRERIYENSATPLRSGDRVTGVVSVWHDVSEREATLLQLKAANRDLEAFSYSVSHDLRTPLSIIDGYSQLIQAEQSDRLDEEGRQYVESIRNGIQRMNQMIQGLLQFSRAGRHELHTDEIDMDGMARDIFDEACLVQPQQNLVAEFGNLPPAHGDWRLIRQVFQNLIGNALKFSSHCSPARIEIGGRPEGHENLYWIKDNGAGFDSKYADQLFGVFQRLHHSDEFEGTGVGLAIVNRIIERHGGRVCAEAQPGEGATFYFTLPKESR